MRRQKEIIDARQVPEITIRVDIDDKIESYSYASQELVLGRDPVCDLVLDASTVSAQHTRLSYHHQNWWAEDLGSRNGTLLNLVRVTTPSILVSGDELQLGQVQIKISINDETREPA